MGAWTQVTSLCDEREIAVYEAAARTGAYPAKGGIVLVQEIFGVTPDITGLCDEIAAKGYRVVAPSVYDRIEPRFTADHATPEGVAKARQASLETRWETVTGDIQACVDRLRVDGPVFAMGFCYGGSATWIAAARCRGLSAASAFYGRLIVEHLDEPPQCPIELHFGRTDPVIPMASVERIQSGYPDLTVHVYDAGHGFASSRAQDFDADAKGLSFERTFRLFQANA